MEQYLHDDERIDDLQRKGYRLIQNESLFCFGMDAVLLSAWTACRENDRVLDLGTGTGVIPILMQARTPGAFFTGLEISHRSADMAARSVSLNHLQDHIRIVEGDIREADRIFPAASFDVVTSNPPYMTASHGLTGGNAEIAQARHELLCTLDDVVRSASVLLKSGRKFCMVHRPFRLAEIIRTMSRHHLEPKRMRLVYPFADKEPNMVLIEGIKGGKPRMLVEPPLIIYREPGVYTEEVWELYYGE